MPTANQTQHLTQTKTNNASPQAYAILVWALGCCFFLMDYFVRISPSIMTDGLMSSFHVGALSIGALSAMFFYPYVLLQPIIGALMDRYGPYRLISSACIVCTLSAILFASTHHLSLLFIARFLLGMCCACSFIGTLKLIHNWFDARYFAVLAGITQACGMLGAIFGDIPFAHLYKLYGWQYVMLICAALFAVLSILILCWMRDYPNHHLKKSNSTQSVSPVRLAAIWRLIKQRQIWLNCLYNGMLYAPVVAFTGLWGVPFLARVEHFSLNQSAHQISIMFFGIACGSPLLGALSNYLKKRLIVMRLSAFIGLILTLEVVYSNYLLPWSYFSPSIIIMILFFCGFFAGGIIPSYSIAVESSMPKNHGIALGLTNMASLGIGALLMPLIGWVLDLFWQGKSLHHHPIFSLHSYQYALALLPLCILLAWIVSFFMRETNCKQM